MTQQIKHTPGPWALTEDGLGIKAGFNFVSVMTNRWKGESKANAHLIAAAPELLEALKFAYELLQHAQEGNLNINIAAGLQRSHEAIAKAEGSIKT